MALPRWSRSLNLPWNRPSSNALSEASNPWVVFGAVETSGISGCDAAVGIPPLTTAIGALPTIPSIMLMSMLDVLAGFTAARFASSKIVRMRFQ